MQKAWKIRAGAENVGLITHVRSEKGRVLSRRERRQSFVIAPVLGDLIRRCSSLGRGSREDELLNLKSRRSVQRKPEQLSDLTFSDWLDRPAKLADSWVLLGCFASLRRIIHAKLVRVVTTFWIGKSFAH